MQGRTLAIGIGAAVICLAAWGAITHAMADGKDDKAKPKQVGPPKDAKFVGTKTCRKCHSKDHRTYRKTKHAKTFSLLQGDETKNPDCLKCHTTGYGRPGGFVSEDKTPKLKNTGCESCHGPGSAHAKAAKDAPDEGPWDKFINEVPQNTCIECHNPHVNQAARVKKLRAAKKGG